MPRRKTLEEFVAKSNLVHQFKYDYSKVVYTTSEKLVEILCPIHGSFFIRPATHMHPVGTGGCQKCSNQRLTQEYFLVTAAKVHGGKYNYDKSKYKNTHSKVIITCIKHGDFEQSPTKHINGFQGCPSCSKSGFSKQPVTTLYVYKSPTFCGFGITRNMVQRHYAHTASFKKSKVEAELVREYVISGTDALDIETEIKSIFFEKILDTGIPGFRKEAVPIKYLDGIIGVMEALLHNKGYINEIAEATIRHTRRRQNNLPVPSINQI